MADVFISYSSLDKPAADKVCHFLESQGVRCWIAPRDIFPGADWAGAIIEAIGESSLMVLIYSSHSNVSKQVMREVERAVHKGLPVIPLRLEATPLSPNLEYFISSSHWLDAPNGPSEHHLDKLATTIKHLLPARQPAVAHPATPAAPPAPTPHAGRARFPLVTAAILVLVLGAATALAIAYLGPSRPVVSTQGHSPASTPATAFAASTGAPASVTSQPDAAQASSAAAPFINSIGMTLLSIPAGEFEMGALDSDASALPEERPRHRVKLSQPFYISALEVTQGQAEKVLGRNNSFFSASGPARVTGDTSRRPADSLFYEDALEFCEKLSLLPEELRANRAYSLPTEAQWEYTCRAGTSTLFPWGDTIQASHANFDHREDRNKGFKGTRNVAAYPPNNWGLYDTIGNVHEWCADFKAPYPATPQVDPVGPPLGIERIRRGGYCFSLAAQCRASARSTDPLARPRAIAGIRPVCNIVPPNALTAIEQKAGWNLLFDGQTASGWRTTNKKLPQGWQIQEGCFTATEDRQPQRMLTLQRFDDFEVSFDFKLNGGGWGMFLYRVNPGPVRERSPIVCLGVANPSQDPTLNLGAIKEVVPADRATTLQQKRWYRIRVTAVGRHIVHHIDGVKVLEIDIGSEVWKKHLAASKTSIDPDFAEAPSGYLGFGAHLASFRNIKIRPIPPTVAASPR